MTSFDAQQAIEASEGRVLAAIAVVAANLKEYSDTTIRLDEKVSQLEARGKRLDGVLASAITAAIAAMIAHLKFGWLAHG